MKTWPACKTRTHSANSRLIPLQFARRRYTWDFEVADVKKPILGADFLMAHGLVVDIQRGILTSNEDRHLTIACDLHVLSTKGEYSLNRIHRLLEDEFPDVAGLQPFNHPPPAAQVYHSVDTADTAPIHLGLQSIVTLITRLYYFQFSMMDLSGI